MVKRKDNSSRIYFNYIDLKKITRNKFPIPNVGELLDELHGMAYFTKLDLKSGYHQLILKGEDIPKTSFKTHEGNYEFLDIPFRLTNAHYTFQSIKEKKVDLIL